MSSAPHAVAKIRDRVKRGILPHDEPQKIYAGYGQQLPCDGCDEPILPSQVEYEFVSAGGSTIRLHVRCAALLQAEQQLCMWAYRRIRTPTRPTVDIVDDDASIAEALQLVLGTYGLNVQTFASAEAFLESKPCDRKPACLLLDVHLTGMTGFDLNERLRALGLSIPTVFMTGFDDGQTRERARNAGALAYLCKPFDNEALIAAVRKATGED